MNSDSTIAYTLTLKKKDTGEKLFFEFDTHNDTLASLIVFVRDGKNYTTKNPHAIQVQKIFDYSQRKEFYRVTFSGTLTDEKNPTNRLKITAGEVVVGE